MTLTPQQIAADPFPLAAEVAVGKGDRFQIRPLLATDTERLGLFFDALTDASRRVYGPHPLNSEHAKVLCDQIDYGMSLRFVALGPLPTAAQQIVGYMILDLGTRESDAGRYAQVGRPLDGSITATFAPVIADAWQEHGLGSAMIPVITEAARQVGRRQIVLMGGVRDDNPRARHFYEKFGFVRVGGFVAGGVDNHDMILQLPDD